MRKKLAILLGAAGLLVAAAPMWAHHAFAAEFDAQKPVKLKGTVVKVEFINPHSWIHMDVRTPTARSPAGWSKAAAPTPCSGAA